ncbi:hypothetical protein H1235_02910 [Pseudoxanthomonas sp. NC8]|nr:hypothetical protein H1235_02910 [Pseudoxanthomonas sp. NC8]
MRRLLPLLLLTVPVLCWATVSETESAPKKAACVYARPAPTVAATEGDAPQARPATPPAARSTPKPTAPSGGGGDGEAVAPQVRGSRWHSFLPGMFR